MKRILFILHLPPPVHGAAMMGEYVHKSELINKSFDCRYINLSSSSTIEEVEKLSIKKVFRLFKIFRETRRVMKEFSPDVVYLTPNSSRPALIKDVIVVKVVRRYCKRVVLHLHNKGVSSHQDRWIDNLLYRRLFKGNKVILLSDILRYDIEKYVSGKDVFICPNGIPAEAVSSDNERIVPRVLFLSNLIVSKGILTLLDACGILMKRGARFECVIVGKETNEMSSRQLQREIDSREINNCVSYLGAKYGSEKWSCLADSDMLVFPTYNDIFGLVLLEAMSSGLPVISTDEGAIPDIIDDGVNGIICKKQDPESLADAMQKLIEDNALRTRMGQEGRKKFLEKYTVSSFESRMVDILQQV